MRLKVYMIALIGTIALCASACSSTRSATKSSELRVESLETVEKVDSVIVMVFDTITITKTITIRESESGDTLRMTTVTDRERIRSMSDVRSKKEDVYVRTDTVYVEKEAEKTVAVVGPGTEIDEQGNIKHQPSYIRLLKWLFLTLIALTALIIVIRIFLKR